MAEGEAAMVVAVLLVTVGLAIIAVRLAARPLPQSAVARFARHHGLAAPLDPTLANHVALIRRWRATGIAVAVVICVVVGLPAERVQIDSVWLAVGWLAGVLVAICVLRPVLKPAGPAAASHPVPRLLAGTLPAVAVLSAAATAVMLVASDHNRDRIALLGGAALLVLLIGYASGTALGGCDTAAATAVAGSLRHEVGAAAAACAVLFLGQAIGASQETAFGHTRTAVEGIRGLWAIGAAVLAAAVIVTGWRPVGPARLGSGIWHGSAAVLVLVAPIVWLGHGLWRDQPPYPASAIDARATVAVTDFEHFEQVAAALDIDGLTPLVTDGSDVDIVGRVDFRPPPEAPAGTTYHVLLIDTAVNTVASLMFGIDGGGWDGFLDDVPRQYPQLSAISRPDANPMAVSAPTDRPGPIAFVALFPGRGPIHVDQLDVVLILTGPQQEVYWVTSLPVQQRSWR